MVSLTVTLDDDVDAALHREAAASGRSVDEVLNDLIRRHQAQAEYVTALDEGIAEADRDEVVDGDDVFPELRARLERMRSDR